MSIRVILVPLFGANAETGAMSVACGIARRFDGHVVGLFPRIDPLDIVPYVGEGISPSAIEQLTATANQEMDRERKAAREQFDRACKAAGVSVTGGQAEPGGVTAHFAELTGRREEIVVSQGHAADLTVFGCADAESGSEHRSLIEAAVLGSGRPVLLTPAGWSEGIGHKIAIAWHGRTEAARALALAMPFVDAASEVHLLTAPTSRTRFEVSHDVAAALRWHGVTCERHVVKAEDEPVGAALLRSARHLGADLLVMGAYSRSRLSELVLGGVTRHVLNEADLPVLMAH